MGEVDKIVCCRCYGLGRIMNAGIMPDCESKLGTTVTCEICNGLGYTNNLYAVEFQFNQKSDRYWLPILILADKRENTVLIAEQIKNEISACFQQVSYTAPKRVFSKHIKVNFLKTFLPAKKYKFYLLNLKSCLLKEPEGKPGIRFDKHLMFRATNTALIPRIIDCASKENIYPVRVIDASFVPPEHLIINCQMRREKWILKKMLNNDWI